jgi:putative membrane protein
MLPLRGRFSAEIGDRKEGSTTPQMSDDKPGTSSAPDAMNRSEARAPLTLLGIRGLLGGILMGLANLVPGISGGTMLLAAGIYPRFIEAIAEITTFRFRLRSLVVLVTVGIAAVLAILLLAGTIKDLVVHHRWVMYSLFIGLTLGGIPVVWRLARPASGGLWAGAAGGFVAMVALALLQQAGASAADASGRSYLLLLVAGVAGASAMILPGVSGGYLLLVLGQYIPILSGIDAFKNALKAGDLAGALEPAIHVLLPVGIGVVVGVVAVSNLLRWLLVRYRKPTLGVLLGLLVGAVVGLWPFQETSEPILGETIIKGRVVTSENLSEFDVEDYPTSYFNPGAGHIGGAVGLILIGLLATTLIARIGGGEERIGSHDGRDGSSG